MTQNPARAGLRSARDAGPAASLSPAAKRRVERAAAALRAGDAVRMTAGADAARVRAAELVEGRAVTLDAPSGAPVTLAVTAARAASLGLAVPEGADAITLQLDRPAAGDLLVLADPGMAGARSLPNVRAHAPAGAALRAALALAKQARLLPAVLVEADPAPVAEAEPAQADAEDVAAYRRAAAVDLEPVADARVPLDGAEDARIHAFRPRDGGPEHLAIAIGRPDPQGPVLARLHSECFTGDLLGSLRCDCGDQLRGAIRTIAEAGGGVILYLAQEGRGIGLVNKLRAYRLQDAGADTLEANMALGFDADERIYLPAAEMLRQLGIGRVRLLTNNPDKVTALADCGIEVAERVPHSFPSNNHNELYLDTKARRFGHRYDADEPGEA
jgi:GTP cyclohydrolase II